LQQEFFNALNSFYSLRSPWNDFKHLGWMDGMKKIAFNMAIKFGANMGSIKFIARA